MYTDQYKFKYLEWRSPQEIHQTTLSWQSQMDFALSEQSFLDELLSTYTLDSIDERDIITIGELISRLAAFKEQIPELIIQLIEHRNALEVLTDGIDEFQKEKAFKDRHLLLKLKIENYMQNNRKLKGEIFDLIRGVLKKKKKKCLA